jgi:CubicO group peptidase (beta-lactamase class C family)
VRALGAPEPLMVDDVFRIASITKPFVATLVVSLVEQGLLDLDAPPEGTDATIRQLLSHQGGLASERAEPIEGVAPGELFSYSNAGFWLVGGAIERVTGLTFEEAMQRHVLAPFGLEHTGFEVEDGVPGHHQVAPGGDEHRRAEDEYPRERRPSGGLWSTVEDLLRFARRHLDETGPLAELRRPAAVGPGFRHGLGWFLRERRGLATVEHEGSVAGYQSLLLLVPEDRLALAALTNSGRGSAAIHDLLDSLGLALTPLDDVPLPPEELDRFVGRYQAPGIRTAVERVDGCLRVTASERVPLRDEIVEYPPFVARPVGPREFEVVNGELRGEILGFPRDGFLSFGVLSRRVS